MKTHQVQASNDNLFVTRGEPSNFTPNPNGLGYELYYKMSRYRNAVAQIDALTGVKDTYGHLLHRCICTAQQMRRRGITSEDIITICSLNNLNSCVPYIAGLFLGAKLACLDPALSTADVVHLVKQVRPKIAFVGLESLQLIEDSFVEAEVDAEIVTFGYYSHSYSDFREFVALGCDEKFHVYRCNDVSETSVIYFSSGTTGLPKGICISHRAMLSQCDTLRAQGFQTDVVLSYATLYWISTTEILLSCIYNGTSRVIVPEFKVDIFWKLLEQHKVTLAFMPPIQAISIYKAKRPEGINTTHLSDILIGGGPLSVEHMQEFREIFPGTNVSLCYGQTEVSGSVLNFYPSKRSHIMAMYQKPGSVGIPSIGAMCKISDPDTGEILGPNERGEICVKTPSEMNGYYNMDSSTSWDNNGWLKTGDIGYYDDEGYFYVIDRLKEMLKFQGFHVSPASIEAVLLTHPSIAAAVVVSLQDDVDGDLPLGVVVLRDPNDSISPEEIQQYVEQRVSDRQKLRGGVEFVTEIPITASGKIKRTDIIKWARKNKS